MENEDLHDLEIHDAFRVEDEDTDWDLTSDDHIEGDAEEPSSS